MNSCNIESATDSQGFLILSAQFKLLLLFKLWPPRGGGVGGWVRPDPPPPGGGCPRPTLGGYRPDPWVLKKSLIMTYSNRENTPVSYLFHDVCRSPAAVRRRRQRRRRPFSAVCPRQRYGGLHASAPNGLVASLLSFSPLSPLTPEPTFIEKHLHDNKIHARYFHRTRQSHCLITGLTQQIYPQSNRLLKSFTVRVGGGWCCRKT